MFMIAHEASLITMTFITKEYRGEKQEVTGPVAHPDIYDTGLDCTF